MKKETKKRNKIVIFESRIKSIFMDIAVKKIELIEWLAGLQDESLIQKIEVLRKSSIRDIYEQRMPKTMEGLQEKLDRSEQDIKEGKVHSQEEIESFFKTKFDQ